MSEVDELGILDRGVPKRHKKTFESNGPVFVILILVMVSWVYTNVRAYHILYFKHMQFIIWQSYFNEAVNF